MQVFEYQAQCVYSKGLLLDTAQPVRQPVLAMRKTWDGNDLAWLVPDNRPKS